jgi:hypothetical protein
VTPVDGWKMVCFCGTLDAGLDGPKAGWEGYIGEKKKNYKTLIAGSDLPWMGTGRRAIGCGTFRRVKCGTGARGSAWDACGTRWGYDRSRLPDLPELAELAEPGLRPTTCGRKCSPRPGALRSAPGQSQDKRKPPPRPKPRRGLVGTRCYLVLRKADKSIFGATTLALDLARASSRFAASVE